MPRSRFATALLKVLRRETRRWALPIVLVVLLLLGLLLLTQSETIGPFIYRKF